MDEDTMQVSPDFLAAIKQRRPNGRLLNLDRILLHSEPLTAGWQIFFTKLRQELHISGQIRELVILRVALINHAPYEFAQHGFEALKEGITQTKIDALTNWQDSLLFDKPEQAALAYTDAMSKLVQVPDPVFANLRTHFNEQAIVELTAVIAGYNMVSRFLEALQITTEGE